MRRPQFLLPICGCPPEGVRCILEHTMARCTLLVSRSSINTLCGPIGLTLILFAGAGWAQLREGPGKAETERICKQCHELERSISIRQDRAGWQATMEKMAALGATGTQKEFDAVVEYLAKNFPAGEVPRINV